jgi:CDP-glucose 4,6-dehydratase
MADFSELQNFYSGKKVLVTGHTGFKGAWLSHVLLMIGARVVGVSLPPAADDGIYVKTGLESDVETYFFDIREKGGMRAMVMHERPDVVMHLAAQPIVRRSYDEPLLTIETNVIGTANVLEAVRHTPSVRSAVIITTDKVYENREWMYGYREIDPLGGHDPYSGSKAGADIIAQMYWRAFFNPEAYGVRHQTLIGIARAGNVIGGGDWSQDRLIPDIMRAVLKGDEKITLRNPNAVRPWEHVLEPISGYLRLGMRLGRGETEMADTYNFGPEKSSWLTVQEVTERALSLLGSGSLEIIPDMTKHEFGLLTLDTTKAERKLMWKSRWNVEKTLEETVRWYKEVHHGSQARKITEEQIASYFNI